VNQLILSAGLEDLEPVGADGFFQSVRPERTRQDAEQREDRSEHDEPAFHLHLLVTGIPVGQDSGPLESRDGIARTAGTRHPEHTDAAAP
jgi:hypothetical protein